MGRERRTSRDTSTEGLFVRVDWVLRLRGWVGRSRWRGRFVDAGLRHDDWTDLTFDPCALGRRRGL